MGALAAITINMPPDFEVFGLTIAWHGLMTAVGIALAAWIAMWLTRRAGLDPDETLTLVVVIAIAGIVGAKLLYMLINEPADLVRPDRWLENRGFAFYGAVVFGPIAALWWLRRKGLPSRYLDFAALGFPLGTAVGRVGDLIAGEHYGPPSDLPWAVRYLNPESEVPEVGVAYQSGPFYEIVLGLVLFAIVWPLRERLLRTPLLALCTVVGLYGVGRFAMFFERADSEAVVWGIDQAQLISVGLVIAAVAGARWALRRQDPGEASAG